MIHTSEPMPLNPNRLAATRDRIVLAAGEVSAWIPAGSPEVTVNCIPGGGGTMKAECTFALPSMVEADNRNGTSLVAAIPWGQGTAGVVSATTADVVKRATAIRFTATTTAGVGEIAR